VGERWTAQQCGDYIGRSAETWRAYVRRRKARPDEFNPAPASVGYDPNAVKVWDADEVRAWQARRRGQDWREGQKDAHTANG
jgi:hypothetical protein